MDLGDEFLSYVPGTTEFKLRVLVEACKKIQPPECPVIIFFLIFKFQRG